MDGSFWLIAGVDIYRVVVVQIEVVVVTIASGDWSVGNVGLPAWLISKYIAFVGWLFPFYVY